MRTLLQIKGVFLIIIPLTPSSPKIYIYYIHIVLYICPEPSGEKTKKKNIKRSTICIHVHLTNTNNRLEYFNLYKYFRLYRNTSYGTSFTSIVFSIHTMDKELEILSISTVRKVNLKYGMMKTSPKLYLFPLHSVFQT